MADIRIRDLSKDHMQKVDAIRKFIKLPIDPRSKGVNKTPEVILAMINRFMNDQKKISELQREVAGLEAWVNMFTAKETSRKKLLEHALTNFKAYTKGTEKLLSELKKHASKKRRAK